MGRKPYLAGLPSSWAIWLWVSSEPTKQGIVGGAGHKPVDGGASRHTEGLDHVQGEEEGTGFVPVIGVLGNPEFPGEFSWTLSRLDTRGPYALEESALVLRRRDCCKGPHWTDCPA